MILTPAERVRLLEAAFYRADHDRDRMAAVLIKAADLVLMEYERGVPNDMSRLRWNELQRISRHLRQYASELQTAEPQ